MWLSLFTNFAVIGLFLSIWTNVQDWALSRSPLVYSVTFGLVMGMASATALMFSFDIFEGVKFDLRATTVAAAAMLGGPVAAAIAASVAILARLSMGGAGAIPGVVSIVLAAGFGLAASLLWRNGPPKAWHILLGSVPVAITPLIGTSLLPASIASEVLHKAGAAIAVLTLLTSFIAVYLIVLNSRRAAERVLLMSAIEQAPDFLYIKTPDSRFVAANRNVVAVNGLTSVDQIKGRTDRELTDPVRAEALLAEEREIVATGVPILDKAEEIEQSDGVRHHYLTSKTPIRLGRGNIIGLVGVSRDITAMRQFESDLAESRDQLSFVLQEMSDGVALITHDGHLVLTNERYREMFPRTGHLRVEGGFLPTILQAALDTGEQPAVENPSKWMSSIMGTLRAGGEETVRLFNGQWLHIRTQVHKRGLSTVVATDITALKNAETNLVNLTKQLELLAATDGLTHLLNRRGFDEAIEREAGRARRSDKPISLLILDVDRFKAFNDQYGHQDGDDCLRAVAALMLKVVRRPVDVVARYGGEEFAVLLPDTGSQGAYHVAEQIRTAVRGQSIVHEASEKGIVTISVGVATFEGIDPALSPKLLIARADEALYHAKGSGRDKTTVWSDPKKSIKSVVYL
jgi:diguanylate cyclase (GGDEF)-like protein/PAS domain S-box-containing protein